MSEDINSTKKKEIDKVLLNFDKNLKELNQTFGDGGSAKSYPKALNRLVDKITKANLWLYILRLLQEKPHYGYEIKNKIREKFGFSPAIVSGYVILYKMKKDNLVDIKWEHIEKNQNSGKPNRKYYYITDLGEKTMKIAKNYLDALMSEIFDKT